MSADPLRRGLVIAASVAVAAFVAGLIVRFEDVALVIYSNSDNAASPVIAELFGERAGGDVVLGNYPWLETLYFMLATEGLPGRELIWEAGPFVLFAAAIGCVWWSTRRAVSAEAGTIVALAMAAPAPYLLFFLGAPALRGTTFAHVALLSAFAVTLPALARWRPRSRAAWAIALALTIAPGAASDPVLFGIAGPLPLVAAAGAGWLAGALGRGTALLTAGACVAGVALGRALLGLAEGAGVTYRSYMFPWAGPGRAWDNLGLLLEDMALFVHGRFSHGTGFLDVLLEAIAVAAVIALPVLVVLGAVRAVRLARERQLSAEQAILGAFWAVVVAALWGAFVTSTAPEDLSAIRYVTMVWPGLLVLAVLLWRRRGLTALAALALVTAVLGCVQLASGAYGEVDPEAPRRAEADELTDLIEREGLARGYGDYWDAAALTYLSDYEARVYPVRTCGPGFERRCPFTFHYLDAWYDPDPGTRSFYLRHLTREAEQIGPPPAAWGPPERKVRIGSIEVYVYDYDLATVLGDDEPEVPARSG